MDHSESHFITGCNVIKYLHLSSRPIDGKFEILIDLTPDGESLLELDRMMKKNNYMSHYYNLQDIIKKL